jgi:hypothetical protein
MTYALREARYTVQGALPARIAPLVSRNALRAQRAPASWAMIRVTDPPASGNRVSLAGPDAPVQVADAERSRSLPRLRVSASQANGP